MSFGTIPLSPDDKPDGLVLSSMYEKLESENAKLRELLSCLLQCWKLDDCEGCPMQDDDGWCVRDIRLRELGMEVD